MDLFNKIGYFHGRFQPFHNGHLEVVNFALEKCDLLALGISNPFRLPPVVDDSLSISAIKSMRKACLPENNFWPYWVRVLMIREGLQTEGIDLQRIVIIPNLNNTGLPLDEVRFPKELTRIFVHPKDPHNHDIAQQYQRCGWEVISVPFQRTDISASQIREKIQLEEPWDHLVPTGTAKIINEYFEYLLKKLKKIG